MLGHNEMLAPSQWIRRNMLGLYSEKLGRALTEAEVRAQNSTARLAVPDWYREHCKQPLKLLKYDTPIECRQPSWRSVGSAKQEAPASSAGHRLTRKSEAARPQQQPVSPSSSDSESQGSEPTRRTPGNSNTFPRVQPSRKLRNINIVLDERPRAQQPRTHYSLTKSIEVQPGEGTRPGQRQQQQQQPASSHASFLFVDVEPGGATTSLQLFAGMASGGEEEEEDERCTPHTRFFHSANKSSELERIVRSKRRQRRGDSLIRDIIGELDRSLAESSARRRSPEQPGLGGGLVRSRVRQLEARGCRDDDDGCSDSSDSELARSTSISLKSLEDLGSEPDDGGTPAPGERCCEPDADEQQDEQQVHWIPAKVHELARTSSRLSLTSRASGRSGFQCSSGRCSPGLSPIKREPRRDEWAGSLVSCKSAASRGLFRIDESQGAATLDSGCCSDRSRSAATASSSPPLDMCDRRRYSPFPPSSPELEHLDHLTTDMLLNICAVPPSIRV